MSSNDMFQTLQLTRRLNLRNNSRRLVTQLTNKHYVSVIVYVYQEFNVFKRGETNGEMAMILGCFGQEWVLHRSRLTNSGYVYSWRHYNEVKMSAMASQITSFTIVYSSVYSGTDERKHQSSASLAFVKEILWWPVNCSHKGPVTRKMFPFDDAIMINARYGNALPQIWHFWHKHCPPDIVQMGFLFAKIVHYDLCTMMWYLLFCNGLHSVIQWQSDLCDFNHGIEKIEVNYFVVLSRMPHKMGYGAISVHL